MTDRDRIISEVERYWTEAGLSRDTVTEMRDELYRHLVDAEADGRTVADVIGPDPGRFAESWGAASRGNRKHMATWAEVQSGETAKRRGARRDLWMYGTGIVAVLAAAALAGNGGNDVDSELWRWLWTGFALVLGIGEIFTAGFFLLPFAIGGAAAAVLAWIGTPIIAQWLVFFGVSIVALAYLRRFIDWQDKGEQPVLGANRWVTTQGVVLEDIDPVSGAGMVRVQSEEWRATADQPIRKGTKIVVTEVRGTRFLVEPIE